MIFNTGESSTDAQINRLIEAVNNNIAELSRAIAGASFNAVKSVQRGIAIGSGMADVTVNINRVNPSKCIVLLNPTKMYGGVTNDLPKLLSMTETTLVVGSAGVYQGGFSPTQFSWQVIEFY